MVTDKGLVLTLSGFIVVQMKRWQFSHKEMKKVNFMTITCKYRCMCSAVVVIHSCLRFCQIIQRRRRPGPAGPALAGPLFSGSLPDCRDNLRTRRLVQVSTQTHLCPACTRFSYNRSHSFAGAARSDCISAPT